MGTRVLCDITSRQAAKIAAETFHALPLFGTSLISVLFCLGVDLVGASSEEIVIMNTLTVNLHLMMVAYYKPTQKRHKILTEWRPFPSDWYAVESHIEWHGYSAQDSMLLAKPDEGSYIIPTSKILSLITEYADELALVSQMSG